MDLPLNKERVFVVGDLNIDNVVYNVILGGNQPLASEYRVGGTGVGTAIALSKEGFLPILFGKVGNDYFGKMIFEEVNKHKIVSLVEVDESKPTGICNLLFFSGKDNLRTIFYDVNNANDYDIEKLKSALAATNIRKNDFLFTTFNIYQQTNRKLGHCKVFFDLLNNTGARVILDLVPHNLYEHISLDALLGSIGTKTFILIGEHTTFMNLINKRKGVKYSKPNEKDFNRIKSKFDSEFYICRFGHGNISCQTVFYQNSHGGLSFYKKNQDTGYLKVPDSEKRGFGDILTAKDVRDIIRFSGRNGLR